MGLATVAAGGHELRELVLSADLFAVAAMQQGSKDLLAMTVAELKAELEARGEGKSGIQQVVAAPAAARSDCVRVSAPAVDLNKNSRLRRQTFTTFTILKEI